MKRQWSAEELVEQFTLMPDETDLLANKSGANCLGFALLLKFFEIEARFPTSRQEVPQLVISYIAKQLDLSPRVYREYEWQGRTIERHRAEIRDFFGFRESTLQDAQELTADFSLIKYSGNL